MNEPVAGAPSNPPEATGRRAGDREVDPARTQRGAPDQLVGSYPGELIRAIDDASEDAVGDETATLGSLTPMSPRWLVETVARCDRIQSATVPSRLGMLCSCHDGDGWDPLWIESACAGVVNRTYGV